MTIEILFGVVAVVSGLALFFLQADPAERENVVVISQSEVVPFHQIRLPTVCKEVIMAMAQRSIYRLVEQTDEISCGGDLCGDDRWTSGHIVNACVRLDAYEANVLELEQIINAFCDQMEKMIDIYEENVCEYNESLALFTDVRLSVEKEVYQSKATCKNKQQPTEMTKKVNNSQRNEGILKVMTTIQCPAVVTNGTEDDFLFVYDQFVDGNLKTLAFTTDEQRQHSN